MWNIQKIFLIFIVIFHSDFHKALKQALNPGLILTRVHRVIHFNQEFKNHG